MQRKAKTYSKRYVYPNVQSNTIHNRQDLEVTQMSTDRCWMRKMWFTYTMEDHSASRRTAVCRSMRDVEAVTPSEASRTERQTPCDVIHMQSKIGRK